MTVLTSIRLNALTNDNASAPELVLLHGWGMSSIVWQDWLPLLQARCNLTLIDLPGYGVNAEKTLPSIEKSLDDIAAVVPRQAIYIGYSLGGMLALQLANRFPARVTAVVTLSSNHRFLADAEYPFGMDAQIYKRFFQLVQSNSKLALKRFAGLQLHGAENAKVLLKKMQSRLELLSNEALSHSLVWLSSIDNSTVVKNISCPLLQLFGECDNLVPVQFVEKMASTAVSQQQVISAAPHNLFVSHPQQCWHAIEGFLQQYQYLSIKKRLEKSQVARSFGRSAATYDSAAELQRQVGARLLDFLPADTNDGSVSMVLDLGCGTGYFSSALQAAFPAGHYFGMDLAEGMVTYAQQYQRGDWLCGDAEKIPLADNSIDIIFSSLAIQWCEDLDSVFAEIARVLKPGGQFIFSTLGPDTLHELREAWRQVDDYVHVNRFVEQQVLDRAAKDSSLQLADDYIQQQEITLQYDTLKQLTAELKALGAHNVNSGRPAGLTGKNRMQKFIQAYERQRNTASMLPASYQVWYGRLSKPLAEVDVMNIAGVKHGGA